MSLLPGDKFSQPFGNSGLRCIHFLWFLRYCCLWRSFIQILQIFRQWGLEACFFAYPHFKVWIHQLVCGTACTTDWEFLGKGTMFWIIQSIMFTVCWGGARGRRFKVNQLFSHYLITISFGGRISKCFVCSQTRRHYFPCFTHWLKQMIAKDRRMAKTSGCCHPRSKVQVINIDIQLLVMFLPSKSIAVATIVYY